MNASFERFGAINPQGLHAIGERLHDEYFRLHEIGYDEKAGLLKIPFQRIFHDGPRRVVKNRILYRVEEVDIRRGIVRFGEVITYEARDRACTGSYSFNRFQYEADRERIIVYCVPYLELLIQVNRLCMDYEEQEYRGKARITQGWFWDSDSGISPQE